MFSLLHGRGSSPERGVFPWLKGKLESEGEIVVASQLPRPYTPSRSIWRSSIKDTVRRFSDGEEYYTTHSQSFRSVAELLAEGFGNPKGIYALAPFEELNYDEVFKVAMKITKEADYNLAKRLISSTIVTANAYSWCRKPLPWKALEKYQDRMHLFFSLNDVLVDPESQIKLFKSKLPDANYIIEPIAGHFSTSDGFREYEDLWDIIKADIKNK